MTTNNILLIIIINMLPDLQLAIFGLHPSTLSTVGIKIFL